MKLKKSLLLVLCSFVFFSGVIFAAGNKKSNYVEMTLEEFNSKSPNELKKKISITDYYGGGIKTKIKADYSKIQNDNPNIINQIYHHDWESTIVTCTAKGKIEYDERFGGSYSFVILEVENLRSLDDVENARQSMLARIGKIKDYAAKRIESIINESDRIGSEIAKGYVYHGYNDRSRNKKLFLNKALEKGNAYYIPSFKLDGIYAIYKNQDIFAGNEVQFVYVNFANQKLKAEYVDLDNKTDVIVTTDNIVIGNIGYITSSKIYDLKKTADWNIMSNFDTESGGYSRLTYEKICEVEKELGIEQE